MKPNAVTVIIFSILLSGLVVLTPGGTAADGKLIISANTQVADACCQGKRGNVNSAGIIDLGDLSALVSYLTGGGYVLPCVDAANVNGAGIVDLGDLSALVSYLTGGGYVLPDCPVTTVTDIDGNVYQTVTIGTQVWMKENLKVTHYRNGVAIPNVTDGATWAGLTTGAYCEYNNDVNNVSTYGRLYNWYSVADSRNIAPTGWHVPTDAEWQTLVDYLGGSSVAGGKMKEVGYAHWLNPNTGANNESGFSGLPGGYRYSDGTYQSIGGSAYFWSSTEGSSNSAWYRYLHYDYSGVGRLTSDKRLGFSVRCVKGDLVPTIVTVAVSEIAETTAKCGGNITSDGGATVTARGVCWSTNPAPTIANSKTTDGAGIGSFISSIAGLACNTPYYVRAYATNSVGTGYGEAISFTTNECITGTVADIDGNSYQTIKIGNQWWMAANLKVTHYRNGNAIPNITNATTWSGLTTGAYCEYNNDINNVATYGRLYNWYAVADGRNIAPMGWHVPTDAEWQTLVDYLGGDAVAGGKMKEAGTTHWLSPNTGATNESGFSGLPGGYRQQNGTYRDIGYHAYFWSSTENYSNCAWYRGLDYGNSEVYRYGYLEGCGFSVRCVRDY